MDCHRENIIAAGPHPILIDLETLLSPAAEDQHFGSEAQRLARRALTESVLRTYLLPVYLRGLDGAVFDASGFGSDRIGDYEDELVTGFEAMYRFLQHERTSLSKPDSPFHKLSGVAVRFADRHTAQYSDVVNTLRHPDLCRDGADRSLQIERLALARLDKNDLDKWIAERESIECGEIPQFTSVGDHARVVERLKRFDEDDLTRQIDLIRSSLRSRTGRHRPAVQGGSDDPIAIARRLERAAIRGSDGSAAWLQPLWPRELMTANPKRECDIAGDDLFDGAAGIGLFLAAAGFDELAVAAVRGMLREPPTHLGIGGLCGIGSVVYGLTLMSRLLDNSDLLQGAQRAAALITDGRIDSAESLDVTHGVAGALLGLLSLCDIRASDTALASAVRCAVRLGLPTAQVPAGYLHGAAGIAYALCRLYRVTGDPDLLARARAWIECERATSTAEPQSLMEIGQARMASLAVIDDQKTRTEIDRALAIARHYDGNNADHLCWGNSARVNTLVTAAIALDRPELMTRARSVASEIRYREGVPSAGNLRSPGLLLGLPGIGYTLLRLQRPEVLPDILLLG
jgi:lantibiotic modifying enzyme